MMRYDYLYIKNYSFWFKYRFRMEASCLVQDIFIFMQATDNHKSKLKINLWEDEKTGIASWSCWFD